MKINRELFVAAAMALAIPGTALGCGGASAGTGDTVADGEGAGEGRQQHHDDRHGDPTPPVALGDDGVAGYVRQSCMRCGTRGHARSLSSMAIFGGSTAPTWSTMAP